MKKMLKSLVLTGVLLLSANVCSAETTNVYITNNIVQSPQQSSNIMCTLNGSICTNGYFMLSTGGMRYSEPQWKRQTLREKRLAEEKVSAAAKINY